MKKTAILILGIIGVMAAVGCGGPKKQDNSAAEASEIGHSYEKCYWTGEGEGLGELSMWTITREDGLVGGEITFGEINETYLLMGHCKDGFMNASFYQPYGDVMGWIEGAAGEDGSFKGMACWGLNNEPANLLMLPMEEFPENIVNPLVPMDYEDMRKASDYYFSYVADDPDLSTVAAFNAVTPGDGKLYFNIAITSPESDSTVGNYDMKDLEYSGDAIQMKGNCASYDLGSEGTLKIEFFQRGVLVTSIQEEHEYMSISDAVAGFYVLSGRYDEAPVFWAEGNGEEEGGDDEPGLEYTEQYTEIGTLISWVRGGSFHSMATLPVSTEGKPGIEEFFKAVAAFLPGGTTTTTYNCLFAPEKAREGDKAVMDAKAGYIHSDIANPGDYPDGLEMCYWNKPDEHSVVAVRINYSAAGRYDVYPAHILIMFEYDTESHCLYPVSMMGTPEWSEWYINEAFRLPDLVHTCDKVSLPRQGKNITLTDVGTDKVLKWNGDWFTM